MSHRTPDTDRTIFRMQYKCAALLLTLLILLFVNITPAAAAGDSIKALIKKAARLDRHGSHVEAEKLLRQALTVDPGRSETKVALAFTLAKQRRLIEAYDLVFPVAKAEPENARAYSVLGTTLLYAGRFAEARPILNTAIRLDRRQHLAWAGYGMLDFYENDIGESIENLREAVLQRPNEPDYLFALAQVAARAEQYQWAADNYKEFLRVAHISDADRRERIKGLIAFLHYLGQAGTLYAPGGKENTTVPFQLIGNRPVIPVRINGRDEPLRFVLDTGSGISVMSTETARRLKVSPITRGGYARGIGGDGKFEIVYGLLREIEIGEVELHNVPIYLRTFHNDADNIDGYIGLALISKFLTTIDYGNQTFALTRKDAAVRTFDNDQTRSLPLRLTSSGFLSGEVTLQGLDGPLNFIVDTGASVSVISERVAGVETIMPFINDEKMRVFGSAGIKEDVPTYLLPSVRFGSHTRTDIMAVALDLDLINEASGWEQSGILGGNFLKNYRLTFDFKNSKVIFADIKRENE
ncbi:MAG: aspartyl protease family protein [Pyrinomonadaceae bacterium]|nr:aspartyl protease family protein [Pyrinomonadaceae bacterium]